MREYDLTTACWRKSSYSDNAGGESCVEVAYDFPGAAPWRKSTYSDDSSGDSCVEVLDDIPGVVPVRDSKNPTGPVLVVPAAAWDAFVDGVVRAR
ncbi:DUF397 domain-containing protein [Streptomyces formicae]|uniref:DUF397 domain-containing protein n=1 Tax=Streptomyces formicae TaxID=1616117 RepID=A0ABY3WU32_9ACTN|nr:DUF397 domain-containing protein [Streptomyces formicae]UNM15071.1 DUF397 domain-containing protein [Streptomyces formicae]